MSTETMPPGKYQTTLDNYKVGDTIKNHFHRTARITYLYLCDDGRKFLFYEDEKNGKGLQLINQEWFSRKAAK